MRWRELEARQPRLAELGKQKLGGPGVLLVATVRADGSPRISPVEPLFWEGDLWLGMSWRSWKARDLLRDPRVLVHSIVVSRSGEAGEFKARGRATLETGAVEQGYAETVSAELGWNPVVGKFHLFRLEIDEVTFIRWDDSTGDQYVTRWPPGEEYVRRATSATSLGPPEPMADLLSG